MKLNKEKFLKTELGTHLIECVTSWDKALTTISKCSSALPQSREKYQRALQTVSWCQAQWEIYQLMLKQFYGINARFVNIADFSAIVIYINPTLTDTDRTDILFKVERQGK